MNNPFGLPDDLFGAILASAIAEGMNPANNRTMKKPNPEASKQNTTRKMVQRLQRKSMIPMLQPDSMKFRRLSY